MDTNGCGLSSVYLRSGHQGSRLLTYVHVIEEIALLEDAQQEADIGGCQGADIERPYPKGSHITTNSEFYGPGSVSGFFNVFSVILHKFAECLHRRSMHNDMNHT